MRALVLVLDSVGVGHAPDAADYGDTGANTLGHVLERTPGLELSHLDSLGLGALLGTSAGDARASFGRMRECSAGKDTTTGHWEIAGVVLKEPFATFDHFPDALVREIEHATSISFTGNYACSGTQILDELGEEHLRTGHPILYTSADSVLQIAAHEKVLPVERLFEICRVAREIADRYRIGRVIARPFLGEPGNFRRTSNRRDLSFRPPPTILDSLGEHGVPVIGVGKISDIFAGRGIAESFPTKSNREGMDQIDELWRSRNEGLIFANLVDFDMLFGHRRDTAGYAHALRQFDDWLGIFRDQILPDDLVIITADHGNDPTFQGADHTREEVPLFVIDGGESRDLGTRESFADVAASLAEFFGLPEPWPIGKSFLAPCTSRL
ncbi:MAG TPA: phosphopentomutase [Chthoniobacterales bacterium]